MTVLAMMGRIILLGLERIVVKKVGQGDKPIEVTVLFFGIGALLLIPFLAGVEIDNLSFLPYVLASGCVYSITFVLYVRALSEGDVSLVTPIASLNILFLFLLSVLFLQESIGILKISGILLIFYGSSHLKPGVNLLQSFAALIREKPCLYMLISTLLLAVGRTIDKFASAEVSSLLYTFILYLVVAGILLIYLLFRRRLKNIVDIFRRKPLLSTTSGAINAFSYMLLLVALKEIEVSIAVPLTMLSSLLAIILGKYIFQEKIKHRFLAALIIIIGSWLLLF